MPMQAQRQGFEGQKPAVSHLDLKIYLIGPMEILKNLNGRENF